MTFQLIGTKLLSESKLECMDAFEQITPSLSSSAICIGNFLFFPKKCHKGQLKGFMYDIFSYRILKVKWFLISIWFLYLFFSENHICLGYLISFLYDNLTEVGIFITVPTGWSLSDCFTKIQIIYITSNWVDFNLRLKVDNQFCHVVLLEHVWKNFKCNHWILYW